MNTLYIDRKNTALLAQQGILHIRTPDHETAKKLPLSHLSRLVLRANTILDSNTLCALAQAGCQTIALAGRSGKELALVHGKSHNDARRRWQQTLYLADEAQCAILAQHIIRSKIRRQLATLEHIYEARPDKRKNLFDAQHSLQTILQTLATPATPAAQHNLARLRGLEGAAAAQYFAAYFPAFAPALGAHGRKRRPPTDPVNAILSLSYTLLYAQAVQALHSAGLDPALGALHTISHGRAALACDLMEAHRPQIDNWVWQQFRSQTLRPEHFGHDGAGACLLGKAGRAHFYSAWENYAHQHRRSLNKQAQHWAKAFALSEKSDSFAHLEQETQP